jgi:hypothetical protein
MARQLNKSDASNPAMTLWLRIDDQCRRGADLERRQFRSAGGPMM